MKNKKVLVVYYSWSGNTKNVAEAIRQETGGELFEITPVKAYPKNYNACVEQAKKEIRAEYLPALEAVPENLDGCDIIFVGTPNWWSTMAPPIKTFLRQKDLSNKTIIPFCTHGGGGEGHIFADIEKECRNTTVEKGFFVYGNGGTHLKQSVAGWIDTLGIKS